ncbi:MauE/DoxX family redox-associated membrane protein [Flavobacterium rakeshii]|uniref:MauE/DoxX family redox-associated membrane protein n=1 Tax=Flavobacterium rakeshii TaxID=1038845 RepID=UPI002E7AB773|nr:MauE/DoxX family redox-associated membrane protein [Flavobacterium rakeshii]MEE1896978.1 MauE/DoxX family redox-associated membrane protein [Flavobacterium rakeshii]
MEPSSKLLRNFSAGISLLYVLLFVYAATSKLIDFTNFRVQVGQSPLVGAFAEYLIWIVPISELAIALLLSFPKFRILGLYMALGIMVAFTIYIFLILNYSSIVPCSCGGILEQMGWEEHLIFNLIFVVLAVLAIFTYRQYNFKYTLLRLFTTCFCSSVLMVMLYLVSEDIVHYSNRFIRRFPHSPAVKTHDLDLGYQSFYISGLEDEKVYIGSSTAQLTLLSIDSALQFPVSHRIDLDRKDLPFRSVTIAVLPPYFYVADGAVPCFFRGDTHLWEADLIGEGDEFFTHYMPIDSNSVVLRSQQRGSGESILGKAAFGSGISTRLNPNLLEKQLDGLFDTDGHLLYDSSENKGVYVYAYRNQFIVFNNNLKLAYRGNTIDTISKANIEVMEIREHGVKKLNRQPLVVNQDAALCGNLLFIHSRIPGRYEGNTMWRQASIIDVYDLSDNSYRLSFYVYDEGRKKLRDFRVNQNALYALVGTKVVKYEFKEDVRKLFK